MEPSARLAARRFERLANTHVMVRWLLDGLPKMRTLAALACACTLLAGVARADELVAGRVLVKYRVERELRPQITVGSAVLSRVRQLSGGAHVYQIAGAGVDETRALAAALAADPAVEYAEPDYVRGRASAPSRPNDPMFQYQWALPMVRAPQAWSRTTGSSTITVAIVDSGSLPHEDVKTRWVAGWDFITDPVNAADGDGRDPDPTDTGDPTEASSAQHGMHVAGIIGASSNNTLGVTGVDWACQLQPVRVLGVQHGTGVDSDIGDAIRWAAGLHVDGVPDNATPAQVINLSFGGPGLSKTMQLAVDDALQAGAVVIAAAGNTSQDAAGGSPSGLRGVIAVGAVDSSGQLAPYSNYGGAVALMAPGGVLTADANGASQGIISTLGSNQYVYYAGTSQATAFVSAAVALLKAQSPKLTPADVRRILVDSADPSAKCGAGCGGGLLDIDAALVLAASPGAGGDGTVVVGGCGLAGSAPGRGTWLALLLLALVAVAVARRAV
jgi:serine protease